MKVLIVVPRYSGGDVANFHYVFPLGLAYISSMLKNAGHEVATLNLNHVTGAVVDLVSARLSDQPVDCVLSGGVCAYYKAIRLIAEGVHRANTGAKLILGGGLISSEPELMFAALNPDYLVVGEGEATIVELMAALQTGTPVESVAGIICRGPDGALISTSERSPVSNPDVLPYPDFEGLEYEALLQRMRATDDIIYFPEDHPRPYPVIASRACPYLCTFCYHPLGRKYRQRSIDSIMAELQENVPRYRANIIVLYDELFSQRKERVYEFCARIKPLLASLPWTCRWLCYIRVDSVDDEMIRVMKDAGCYLLSYGFESYSPVVLKSMRKHITPEQIDRAVHLTMNHQMAMQANFIFGDLAETTQTAQETLDYFRDHGAAGINLGFIWAYPGSAVYLGAEKRGLIGDKLDFIANRMETPANMTAAMTDREFDLLGASILHTNLKCSYFAVPHKVVESATGLTLSIKCPHCLQMVDYGNCELPGPFGSHALHCRKCYRRFYLVTRIGRWSARVTEFLLSFRIPGLRLLGYRFVRAARTRVNRRA